MNPFWRNLAITVVVALMAGTVGGWMGAAGLAVREDGVGNLIGRLEAPRRGARTLLLGSHLDTVRDAGRFDGELGVLLALAAVEELRRRGIALPYALEVLGFAEEEGVRFAGAYLGSKGYCGALRAADLALADHLQVENERPRLQPESSGSGRSRRPRGERIRATRRRRRDRTIPTRSRSPLRMRRGTRRGRRGRSGKDALAVFGVIGLGAAFLLRQLERQRG